MLTRSYLYDIIFTKGGDNMAKERATFTIEKSTLDYFNELADKKALNKSKWVEQQMIKFIEREVK